jgi:hypothetical protein
MKLEVAKLNKGSLHNVEWQAVEPELDFDDLDQVMVFLGENKTGEESISTTGKYVIVEISTQIEEETDYTTTFIYRLMEA